MGIEGLEKAFDNELSAQSSRIVVQRDAAGRKLYLAGAEDRSDLKGRDVQLTIDNQIQYFTEEALAKSVGERVHAAGTLSVDRWGGNERVDLRLVDIAKPE